MRVPKVLRASVVVAGVAALPACSTTSFRPVSDDQIKIGRPYTVRGVTYTPAEDAAFDVLGYASWYGFESGRQVALGERFRPAWITAAHTTLPLPSYLEVTSLDTGRAIIVRVNDRGPFARGRILDLSRGAAQQLGVLGQDVPAVRVRRVEPPESVRKRLRQGKSAPEQPRASEMVLNNLRAQLAAGIQAGLVDAP